jgi:exodeoxyribonuclease VII small subunit|tara:strand:+ start:306 stop:506 length:201 start_codon:yes stop_codon:yes gene_type:complete
MTEIPSDMKYEDALAKIEHIVSELEQKEVSIDELIKRVYFAKQLVDFCQEKLTKTEKEIEKIIEEK